GIVIGVFVAASKGYGQKKGENLARKEDIDKLIADVADVTQTTREIEARISGELWDKQKQWEMKRDVLFELIKRMTIADNALLKMSTAFKVSEGDEQGLYWKSVKNDAMKKWTDASNELDEAISLADIVCSTETLSSLRAFGTLMA